MSKSAWARELYAGGCHDKKRLQQLTGLSASALWNALRGGGAYKPAPQADERDPTVAEQRRAYELASIRGDLRSRADEIAKEFARIRCAGGSK